MRTPICHIVPISRIYGAWWTFRIFFIFFLLGEGKGESEAPGGGGGRFLIENPRRGGGVSRRGGGGRGAGRVSARNSGRGELNIFFRGRNSHQVGGGGRFQPLSFKRSGTLLSKQPACFLEGVALRNWCCFWLGWHLCRTKLTRRKLIPKRNS